MKVRRLLLGIAISVIMQSAARAEDAVGVRQIEALSHARGVNLDVTVWYPARAGGEPTVLGDSVFFVGTPAMRDAPVAKGIFPLILLSHGAGLGGNPQAMSWIAAPLAGQGFVVAAPTHPGNSGKNRSAAETIKLWLRPSDLTETLNALTRNTVFSSHIEPGKVGVLGLSMGGSTALAIAGARLDPKRLARYCDTDALNASLCGWIRQSGVDLHAMDMTSAGRDYADSRVGAALVIDPAPVDVFDPDSFGGISIPFELINLGKPEAVPVTAQASGVAKAVRRGTYVTIEDASHFSMFGECKPGAAEIAESEQIGDPICMDGGGRPRAALHQQMLDMTAAAFSRALKTGQ